MAHLGWLDDDGIYAVTAKALAEGQGYVLTHVPGTPPQTKYPPLYPLYLSLWWGGGFPALLGAQVALLPVLAALAWGWWRRQGFGVGVCAAMAGFLVLNPFSVVLGLSLMSEVLFTCLLLASVLCRRRAVVSGVLAGLAYLTRVVALPLLAAAPLSYWLKGDRRAALRFVLGMAPFIAAWYGWRHAHRSYSPDSVAAYYTDYVGLWLASMTWADVPALLYKNASALLAAMSGLFTFGGGEGEIATLVFRLFSFASIAGCVRMVRRNGGDALVFYGAGLAALLVIWNYPPHERFVWPLLPLLLAGFAAEMTNFSALAVQSFRAGRRTAAVVLSLGAGCLVAVAAGRNAVALWRDLPAGFTAEVHAGPAREAASLWLREHVDRRAKVAAWNGAQTYFDTGLRGYTPRVPTLLFYRDDRAGFTAYFRALPEFARANRLSYILVTPDDFRGHLSVGEAAQVKASLALRKDLTRLYNNGGFVIYRVEPR